MKRAAGDPVGKGKACGKVRHRSKGAAELAAGAARIPRSLPGIKTRVYQCDVCRTDDGSLAWHWTRDLRRRRS